MDAFDQLIKEARAKRDALIREAKQECRDACKRLNETQAHIQGTPEARRPRFVRTATTFAVMVKEAIPHDRIFDMPALRSILARLHPERQFLSATVKHYLELLTADGSIRRVGGRTNHLYWAAADYKGPIDIESTKQLSQMAERVLRECGNCAIDLHVRIRELGYRVGDDQDAVLRSLRSALRRGYQFQRDGQRDRPTRLGTARQGCPALNQRGFSLQSSPPFFRVADPLANCHDIDNCEGHEARHGPRANQRSGAHLRPRSAGATNTTGDASASPRQAEGWRPCESGRCNH